jgi:hypothetical protein
VFSLPEQQPNNAATGESSHLRPGFCQEGDSLKAAPSPPRRPLPPFPVFSDRGEIYEALHNGDRVAPAAAAQKTSWERKRQLQNAEFE